MQPRFSSMALLIYLIGDLCVFIYNLPYKDFLEFSKQVIYRGYQVVSRILCATFKFFYSLDYKSFFNQSYYSVLTIGYIFCGNYTMVGQILDRHDAVQAEERKIFNGDFISLFEHLKKRNDCESREIADMIIKEIIEEVAQLCECESSFDLSYKTATEGNGWEAEIEILEKDEIRKCEFEKENESGYFEEEIFE